jgi:hypothetical protein
MHTTLKVKRNPEAGSALKVVIWTRSVNVSDLLSLDHFSTMDGVNRIGIDSVGLIDEMHKHATKTRQWKE